MASFHIGDYYFSWTSNSKVINEMDVSSKLADAKAECRMGLGDATITSFKHYLGKDILRCARDRIMILTALR